MTEDKAPMSVGFSVFNGHINNADKRARALMRTLHPTLLAEVEAIERAAGGMMAIFKQDPTPATTMYSNLVCAYVNEDRVAVPDPQVTNEMHVWLDVRLWTNVDPRTREPVELVGDLARLLLCEDWSFVANGISLVKLTHEPGTVLYDANNQRVEF